MPRRSLLIFMNLTAHAKPRRAQVGIAARTRRNDVSVCDQSERPSP